MPNLKPCPFCGGKAKLKKFKSKALFGTIAYYAECSVCKVRTEMSLEQEEPVEAWNRRAGEEDKHEQ